jgi:hypothetical protein
MGGAWVRDDAKPDGGEDQLQTVLRVEFLGCIAIVDVPLQNDEEEVMAGVLLELYEERRD